MAAMWLDADSIHVFPLACGGPADGGAILVRWSFEPAGGGDDRLFQVYLDGELAGVTDDPADRQIVLSAGPGGTRTVAVAAVGPNEAEGDFSSELAGSFGLGRRALLRWPRLNSAELGATVNVFGNGGSGPIDFGRPLNAEPLAWFAGGVGKWGLGLGGFGGDDFGYGGGPAVGLGRGGFGIGEFGFDAEWASWLSGPLGPGTHRLAVVGYDRLGNVAAAAPVEVERVIAAPPPGATALAIETGPNGTLTFAWQSAER